MSPLPHLRPDPRSLPPRPHRLLFQALPSEKGLWKAREAHSMAQDAMEKHLVEARRSRWRAKAHGQESIFEDQEVRPNGAESIGGLLWH